MLSRANSDAASRLRRAKSSSLASHHKPEHIQSPLYFDHAEVAAIEAYRRAKIATDMSGHRLQKTPSSRKRPSRRSEGSYFEESRTGHRIGAPDVAALGRSHSTRPRKASDPPLRYKAHSTENGAKTVVHPRIMVDTSQFSPGHPKPTDERGRRPNSKYLNEAVTSRRHPLPPDDITGSIPYCKPSRSLDLGRSTETYSQQPTLQHNQSGPSASERSPKAPLQRLRAKSSFFRRGTKSVTSPQTITLDASLPPFNSSYEDQPDPSPLPDEPFANGPVLVPKHRLRSASLTTKFKRIFTKEKFHPGLPIQHVPSGQFHFRIEDESGGNIPVVRELPSPNRAPPPPPVQSKDAIRENDDQDRTRTSADEDQTDTSRVTSWSASTFTDTVGSSAARQQLSSIHELPSRKMRAFGEPEDASGLLQSRRNSHRRSVGRSTEESQRLYDALRRQIRDDDDGNRTSTEVIRSVQGLSPAATRVGQDTGRHHAHQPEDYDRLAHMQTIRNVCPDAGKREHSDERGNQARPILHQDADRPEAFVLDQEHRARRLAKSQNRWQSMLREESPNTSRAITTAEIDNPYKLSGCPTSPPDNHIPLAISHARSSPPTNMTGERYGAPYQATHGVLSPSVYSRATDYRSTPSTSPKAHLGTVVTITGREVQTYSIDSPTKRVIEARRDKSSSEWKDWFRGQMHR